MPAPVIDAAVTVTFSPPVFFNVTVCDDVSPITTLPKLMLVGLAVKSPDVTAVPDSGMFKVGSCAFETTATFPLKLPADCGANVTENVTLCPAATVTGTVIPETLNPVPLGVTAVIVALVPPVFLIVSVCEELVPTCTLVKVMLVGLAVRLAGETPCPERAISSSGAPLIVKTTFPVTEPVTDGVKLTLKVDV